jgi:hypothetical protein
MEDDKYSGSIETWAQRYGRASGFILGLGYYDL